MHRSRRVLNPGILAKMASTIRLAVGGRVSGLTKHGILGSQEAKAHIFGAKPNRRCLRGMTLATIENLFLDRTPVSPGIICKSGPRFMKHAFKCRTLETQIHSLITSKPNTSLRRSYSARFAGTSNSSTQSVMATAVKSVGVQTSNESTSPSHIVSRH